MLYIYTTLFQPYIQKTAAKIIIKNDYFTDDNL